MSPIQLVTQALQQRGFRYVHSELGYAYEGKAVVCGQQISARVLLRDDTFVDLPQIQLLERPEGTPDIVPHLSADGYICFAASGTLALDIFDPAGQTLACLDRAIAVADKAIKGEMVDDLTEEFFAYWPGIPVYADVPLSKINSAQTFYCQNNASGEDVFILTDNEVQTRIKISEGVFPTTASTVLSLIFSSGRNPSVRQFAWPPKTLGEFLSWQGELDADCARRVRHALKKCMREGQRHIVLLIQSPTAWYGIFIKIGARPVEGTISDRLNIWPALMRSSIWLLTINRIDDEYLVSRNIPGRTSLINLKIGFVGCGTIGGYLADMLVRAGAGLAGGELALIDSEVLKPGNIGRHRLGLPAMSKNKATALSEELRRIIPTANVTSYPQDVRSVAKLETFDLVIDATGEEALSNYLNIRLMDEHFVPMIFTWIAGTGESIHALIRDTPEAACYRCLTESQANNSATRIETTNFAGFGCESLYVPFSSSVSVSSAALAFDAVMDWASKQSSPRYRIRLIKNPQASHDDAPEKRQGCRACSS